MQWVAPSRKDDGNVTLEKRLWDAADQLRANSGLNAGQYSTPVLGLIFLQFAPKSGIRRFEQRRSENDGHTRRTFVRFIGAYNRCEPKVARGLLQNLASND